MQRSACLARILFAGVGLEQSWHWQYHGCAWVYVGGLSNDLTGGDVIAVMSQWGEIEDVHIPMAEVEDGKGGKVARNRGFAFIKYEDWRSTVLAVDNMNGTSLLGKTLRVDHKLDFKKPE